MRSTGNDRGALRLVTITRLVVVLAIVGVCAYDGVSVMASHIAAQNDAQTAAFAASQEWHAVPNNLADAYQAAVSSVAGKGDTILTSNFTVDADGTVHLELRQRARSVVLGRIGSLRHYTVVFEHGDANSVN